MVVLTLESTFQHYSPVCKVASAYLQATCKNTSEYTFLPSTQVCVFADNNFIATTSLGRVSPGEHFSRCDWLPSAPLCTLCSWRCSASVTPSVASDPAMLCCVDVSRSADADLFAGCYGSAF